MHREININDMQNKITNINPLCDFGFKRIFGTEENKDVLVSFLNCILSDQVGEIKTIEFLNTELIGNMPSERHLVYDIYCTNNEGDSFIIEMQRGKQNHFSNRIISYIARAISHSLKRGDRLYEFPNIYSLNLLDFNAHEFENSDRFFWNINLKDDDNKIFSRKITITFIELRKFAAQVKEVPKEDEKQQWLYLLKNMQSIQRDSLPSSNPIFDRVFNMCNYANFSNMEKEAYRKSVLEYEDVQDAVACAREDGMTEGYKQGVEKGREEGISKGIEQGIEKGILQVACQMLSMGVDVSTIAKATGLSETELEEVKNE